MLFSFFMAVVKTIPTAQKLCVDKLLIFLVSVQILPIFIAQMVS
jgi:hypothetical protein